MVQRLKRLLCQLLWLKPAIYFTLLFKQDSIFNIVFKLFPPAQRQTPNQLCQLLSQFKHTEGKILFGYRVNRK